MPVGDVQFWIVTGAAAVSLLFLLRAVGVLGGTRKRGRKVELTVRGKRRG